MMLVKLQQYFLLQKIKRYIKKIKNNFISSQFIKYIYIFLNFKDEDTIASKETSTNNKKPSISVSGIDDDGKKVDAVLKSENNKNNTLLDATPEEKSHSEDQTSAKENSEVETVEENVKKNVTESVEEVFLPAEVRLKYLILKFNFLIKLIDVFFFRELQSKNTPVLWPYFLSFSFWSYAYFLFTSFFKINAIIFLKVWL